MKKEFKYLKKMVIGSAILFVSMTGLYAESIAKPNPYLSAPIYGITHFDSAQSDSYPYPVVKGVYNFDLDKYPQVTGGPVNIMTFASTSPNYMWGVSNQGVTYIDVSNGGFKKVSDYNFPGVRVVTREMHEQVLRQNYKNVDEFAAQINNIYQFDWDKRIHAGNYAVVDNNNNVYVNQGNNVYKYTLKDSKDPSKGIKEAGVIDSTKFLAEKERITGLSMTYDGHLVIVGNSSLSVVGTDLNASKLQIIHFDNDEYVSNGIAIDEKNGIYVASDKYMRKIIWTGTKLSTDEKDGAWSTFYEIGQQPPTIKVGKGTGSTPTLMGFGDDEDKLVVITDGANRMNIVAFWRDEIPAGFKQKPGTKSNRIADQMPITAGLPKTKKWIQSEQSVAVKDYGAFVVNNIVENVPKGDFLAVTFGIGPIVESPVGVERVEWDTKANKWKSVWTRKDISSISMIPAISTTSNIVLVGGYYKKTGWEITGMDWNTGKTVHQSKFGFDNFGNGQYATIQFFPNGDMLFNSISGPFRLNYK